MQESGHHDQEQKMNWNNLPTILRPSLVSIGLRLYQKFLSDNLCIWPDKAGLSGKFIAPTNGYLFTIPGHPTKPKLVPPLGRRHYKSVYNFYSACAYVLTTKPCNNWGGGWNRKLMIVFRKKTPKSTKWVNSGLHDRKGMLQLSVLGHESHTLRVESGWRESWSGQ
jgi:hypothetical protein